MDGLLPSRISIVSCCGVTGVDREQLPLDIRCQIIDPMDSVDLGVFVGFKWCLIDDPFEEALDLDVQASVGVLSRYDTIDGGVGKTSTILD